MFLSSLFTSQNKRTATIKKNVVFGIGIKGFSILLSLMLVPMTINYISSELYGIWLTLSSIIGWLGFFDVGFGLGLRNWLTTAIALNKYDLGRVYVSTTYFIIAFIFSIVAFIGWFVFDQIDWCTFLNISLKYQSVIVASSRIVLLSFCINIVLKIIQNVSQAYQMTALASFFDMLGQLLAFISIYILTKTTFPSLTTLALVFCSAPIVIYILMSVFMYCSYFKEVAPSYGFVKMSYAKDLFNLGGKFFILQIICIILYQATNFIISHYCGPNQVTVYNISYKYLNCSLMVFNILMSPLWSAYNEASAKNDFQWMRNLYVKLKKINAMVILGIIFMVSLSPIVFHLWIGNSVRMPFIVSMLIGVYMIFSSISNMHAAILNGMGIISLQIFQSILQGVIYIIFVGFFAETWGLEGILVMLIITALIPSIILPLQVNKLLQKKASGIWSK